jgi:N-acylglucosamine 2-epimerase
MAARGLFVVRIVHQPSDNPPAAAGCPCGPLLARRGLPNATTTTVGAVARRAAAPIRRHLEAGWDSEYGGLFLGIGANGGEPFLRHAQTKPWWPHTESLYALLLAHQLTGEKWRLEWCRRVYQWSFAHCPIAGAREWRQRLTRQGRLASEAIALPVNDPFHLPRAAILIAQLLENA